MPKDYDKPKNLAHGACFCVKKVVVNNESDCFYKGADGRKLGPLSLSRLKQLYAEGTIEDSTLIWVAGDTEWNSYEAAVKNAPENPYVRSHCVAIARQEHGKWLSYGSLLVLVPCVGWLSYLVLVGWWTVERWRLSKVLSVLSLKPCVYLSLPWPLLPVVLLLFGPVSYPLMLHLRNRSGVYPRQPLWPVVVTMVLVVVLAVLGLVFVLLTAAANNQALIM